MKLRCECRWVDRWIETFAKMFGKKIMKFYCIGVTYFIVGNTTISFAEFLMHLTGRVGVGLPPEEGHGCPALSAFLASLPQVRHFSHLCLKFKMATISRHSRMASGATRSRITNRGPI